jgi:hypothetical protein
VRRRDLLGLGAGAIAGLALAPLCAAAKPLTDSGGRKIDVPDEVHRVFPAGPRDCATASPAVCTIAMDPQLRVTVAAAGVPERSSLMLLSFGLLLLFVIAGARPTRFTSYQR